jgi:hypothetical protein
VALAYNPSYSEIRRIVVPSQPKQIVHKTLSPKIPNTKRAGGVAQDAGPEFKPQYHKKKKKKKNQKTWKITLPNFKILL